MTINKKEISGTIAYMLGVRKSIIERDYESDAPGLLDSLSEKRNVKVIRYLCKIRTALFYNFKNIDFELRYNLKNLNTLPEYIDVDNVIKLASWGIDIIQVNSSSQKYLEHVNYLINENIDKCQDIFDDWVRFDYIRELFMIPRFQSKGVLKKEFSKFMQYRNYYPFQMYMYWKPSDKGNILFNDERFLNWLYSSHKAHFTDISKTRDASEDTKEDIYEFIEEGQKIAIVVDCENSDVFKLYGVLRNLESESLSHIDKIVLYDDEHTSEAWQWLSKFTKIPVEYIEVERVTEMKSLVDLKMTAGVCKDHYQNNIDSFILFSSDSDYWGLISSLPDASFMVMYEHDIIGYKMKEALREHDIRNCCIDDFYTGNATELKKVVLLDKLEELLPELIGSNGKELVDKIYLETRITATKNEKENFFIKYIKTLQLKMNENGEFYIHICR